VPRQLQAVGPDFFTTAPQRSVHRAVIRRPPEPVFDAIAADPAGWGDWFPGFDHSGHWVTSGPPGEGSRRLMRMSGFTYDETVIAWSRPDRFAFRVDRSSLPIGTALAEDYRLLPDPFGSVLEWTFAVHPGPVMRWTAGLLHPVMDRLVKKLAANLEKHLPA
jgi:hypothetical protein